MNERHVMTARWRLEAPAGDVWPLLADLPGWPRWWPHLRNPRTTPRVPRRPAIARPDAAWAAEFEQRALLLWRPWPARATCLRITATRVEALHLLEWAAEADPGALASLAGAGCWLIEPTTGGTEVTLRWSRRIGTQRCAPTWLAPVIEWHHFRRVCAGAAGMAELLHCRVPAVSQWAAHRRA